MAFKNVVKYNLPTANTELYVSPDNITTIVFNGFISNKSDDIAYFTLMFNDGVNTNNISLMKDIPIVQGSSILLPKKVVPPKGKLIAKADSNEKLDVSLELLTVEN